LLAPVVLASAALLAPAAAVARPSGVEVTRFHTSQALAGQSVAVTAADPAQNDSLAFIAQRQIIVAELARAGLRPPAADQRADLVASVRLDSRAFEEPKKTQFSIGLGGGSFGRRGGIGVGGNVPVGGRTRSVAEITLAVQIRRSADNAAVWEGRASDVLPAQRAPTATARLAAALFAGFPGPNGETVRVKKVPAPAPVLAASAAPAPIPAPAATPQ
jgi:hypothetical protein